MRGCYKVANVSVFQHSLGNYIAVRHSELYLVAVYLIYDVRQYTGTCPFAWWRGVSREELDRIFTALGDVKGQLDSMKKDIARDREEATDRLVKKLKLDKKTVFKRKGNELQFQFNAEVDEKLAKPGVHPH